MSNTFRFNQAAACRARGQGSSGRRSHSHRMHGPSHGLQGDANSQRRGFLNGRSKPTTHLRHSQVQDLRKRGDAAEARKIIEAQEDVIVEQTYSQVEFDMPIGLDFADSRPAAGDSDSGSSAGSDDEDMDETVRHIKRTVRKEYFDSRTNRRDRTETAFKHWQDQWDPMVDAFMCWSLREELGEANLGMEGLDTGVELHITVIDLWGSSIRTIPVLQDNQWQSASLVRAGCIPTAPLAHTYAFTTRTISLYHTLFCRCPKIGIQPFAKAICDLSQTPYNPYLSTQLSTAYDVYVGLLRGVRSRVNKVLGRNSHNWRMLHTCPCCQYRLKEDPSLDVRMIVAMDGNDSLRRVERRGDAALEDYEGGEDDGSQRLGKLKERPDPRVGGGDFFLQKHDTDAWAEERWEDVVEVSVGDDQREIALGKLWEEGRCEDRWSNMKEQNTARSVGRFYEWGWFVMLCRHMFLLTACDMIRSGEQSKYPLACMHRYMSGEKGERDESGEGQPEGQLAVAYDCACKFGKTVRRSPLKPLAAWSRFLPVIGTMHGYGHERACQLLFLMLYIVACGLEDGEFAERFFSLTNALAGVTRHQSIFHRRQSIHEFVYAHDQLEAYAKLSLFIYNNYRQALGIIRTRKTLAREMQLAGFTTDTFHDWLREEGEYLANLQRTPPKESLEMEYYLKLEALKECQGRLATVR